MTHDLFLAARRPYEEPVARHDLGRMDNICIHCHAAHWHGEKLSNSPMYSPHFSSCCLEGKIQLATLGPPPDVLRQLLTKSTFRAQMWRYNRAFAFTSVGTHEDRSLPPVYRICGELYH